MIYNASGSNKRTLDNASGSKSPAKKCKAAPMRWTPEEDKAMTDAIAIHGACNWKKIATYVPLRNHAQCLQRWVKAKKPGLKKGYWSSEEDDLLSAIVQARIERDNSWAAIADQVDGRTSKQCRERWFHHLDPTINRDPYSAAEDLLIVQQHGLIGGKWATIARMVDNHRTSEAIKTRWQTLRRQLKVNKQMQQVHNKYVAKGTQFAPNVVVPPMIVQPKATFSDQLKTLPPNSILQQPTIFSGFLAPLAKSVPINRTSIIALGVSKISVIDMPKDLIKIEKATASSTDSMTTEDYSWLSDLVDTVYAGNEHSSAYDIGDMFESGCEGDLSDMFKGGLGSSLGSCAPLSVHTII